MDDFSCDTGAFQNNEQTRRMIELFDDFEKNVNHFELTKARIIYVNNDEWR